MYIKLITACQGVPVYKFATYDPPNNTGYLINKITSSISAYKREYLLRQDRASTYLIKHQNTYFTNQRYYQCRGYSRGNRARGYNRGDRNKGYSTCPYQKRRGKCFIYKVKGYYSRNYTPKEQQKSREEFIATYKRKYGDSAYFQEQLTIFISSYKGVNKDDVYKAFKSFIAASKNKD